MSNFKENDNYISLRNIVAEKTNPIVLWLGAGLSASLKMPLWDELKNLLIQVAQRNKSLDPELANKQEAKLTLAEKEKDYWLAFTHIKDVLGKTLYESTIREIFSKADNGPVPKNYKKLMKLRPRGIITTNIDGLSGRALTEVEGHKVIEFSGIDADRFAYAMQAEKTFVLNLHGKHSDATSWIFTKEDFESLQNKLGYNEWIKYSLQKTIVFIGISIDDVAVRKHIEKISPLGLRHYWITSKKSPETYEFCQKNGILIIPYSEENDHEELNTIIDDLVSYKPQEEEVSPVSIKVDYQSDIEIGSEKFNLLPPNQQRFILNATVTNMLLPGTQDAYELYKKFRKEKMRFIHNAWFVNTEEPDNHLLNYKLEKRIGNGAFGDVYYAKDEDNGDELAIKILKEDILQNDAKLQAFRRGVRSMQILSKYNIDGIVKYIGASEIPSIVVMEYINGIDLKEAIDAKQLSALDQKFTVLCAISNIMKVAHHLPERVLHRDLRPQNIMLKDFYSDIDNIQIVLLDFDLSWYKDSTEVSINHANNSNGFLAPELETHSEGQNTRTAQVDSFGMGMLIYYVFTGKEPFHNQHLFSSWEDDVFQAFDKIRSNNWNSIPYILQRTVIRATKSVQTYRPDMSQICGRLMELKQANLTPKDVHSSGLIAEEMICRIWKFFGKSSQYKVNEDNNEYKYDFQNGLSIKFIANESIATISFYIVWNNTGNTLYKKAKQNRDNIIQSFKSVLDKYHFEKFYNDGRNQTFNISAEVKNRNIINDIDIFTKQISKTLQRVL